MAVYRLTEIQYFLSVYTKRDFLLHLELSGMNKRKMFKVFTHSWRGNNFFSVFLLYLIIGKTKISTLTVAFTSFRSPCATWGHTCCSLQYSSWYFWRTLPFLLTHLWWPSGMGQQYSTSFSLQIRVSVCSLCVCCSGNVISSLRHDTIFELRPVLGKRNYSNNLFHYCCTVEDDRLCISL